MSRRVWRVLTRCARDHHCPAPCPSEASERDVIRVLLGLFFAASGTVSTAIAQPYPSRPVTLIVPFGAGGPLDTVARAISETMRVSLGQPVLVENVTGASG